MAKAQKFHPLKGIRVLDLSRLFPGPFLTKILCDLGATVIKVEDTGKGDYINVLPPHVFDDQSVMSVGFHKNKLRLKIDYNRPEGQAVVRDLVKKSHVFVESFRPGVIKRWGLDFASLKKLNPKLVYASLTGYGQGGKRASQAGHDINYMGVSGLLADFLPRSGVLASEPIGLPRFHIADFMGGGLFGAMLILGALREKKARHLDVSLTDALVYLNQHATFHDKAPMLDPITGMMARYQAYRTRDGRFATLGAFEDKFWHRFCELVNRPDLLDSPFDPETNARQIREVQQIFLTRTAAEWAAFGQRHDLCLTVVATREELMADGLLTPVRVANGSASITFQESPLLSAGAKQTYKKPGADNAAVLKKIGYSAKKIAGLKKQGVFG